MFAKKNILVALAMLIVAVAVPFWGVAQEVRVSDDPVAGKRHGVSVDFRVNSVVIDPTYRNNAVALEMIDSLYRVLSEDSSIEIVSIEFCGTASPEGSAAINHRLSQGRMLALENMVRNRIDIPQDIVAEKDFYIAWNQLIELVENDPEVPMRDEVLEILRTEYPASRDSRGVEVDGRITELRKLQHGAVWDMLHKKYFDQMRNAWFIVVTTRPVVPVVEQSATETEPEQSEQSEQQLVTEIPAEAEPAEVPADNRIALMNIKTNAVEVAGLIANIGAEFRLSPNLSLDVIGHYSPYDYFKLNSNNLDRKIRVFAIQPELRYWFGEPLVKGHFLGLHVPVAGFNIQLGDKRYQDPNRALWGVGVSYGYAMPLGKDTNWGVEFTVGLGYMNVVYDIYEGVENGKYLRTQRMNYWGPTRVGVDFSYRFDYNKKSNKEKTLGE